MVLYHVKGIAWKYCTKFYPFITSLTNFNSNSKNRGHFGTKFTRVLFWKMIFWRWGFSVGAWLVMSVLTRLLVFGIVTYDRCWMGYISCWTADVLVPWGTLPSGIQLNVTWGSHSDNPTKLGIIGVNNVFLTKRYCPIRPTNIREGSHFEQRWSLVLTIHQTNALSQGNNGDIDNVHNHQPSWPVSAAPFIIVIIMVTNDSHCNF